MRAAACTDGTVLRVSAKFGEGEVQSIVDEPGEFGTLVHENQRRKQVSEGEAAL